MDTPHGDNYTTNNNGDIPLQDHVRPRTNKRHVHVTRVPLHVHRSNPQQQMTRETKVGGHHLHVASFSAGRNATRSLVSNNRRDYDRRLTHSPSLHMRGSESPNPGVQISDYSTYQNQRNNFTLNSVRQTGRLAVSRSHITEYSRNENTCTDSAYYSEGAWKMIDSACSDYDFTRKVTPPRIANGRGITDACQQYVFL